MRPFIGRDLGHADTVIFAVEMQAEADIAFIHRFTGTVGIGCFQIRFDNLGLTGFQIHFHPDIRPRFSGSSGFDLIYLAMLVIIIND